jgi:hypothetical protein
MELSACSWVRDNAVQLQGTYTNLLTTVQVGAWKYPFVVVRVGHFCRLPEFCS